MPRESRPLPLVNTRSIWHGDNGRRVLLRCRLTLAGPCRDGQLDLAASGPVQLYLDGARIAGAPGGSAAEHGLWHPCQVRGGWDGGEHELVAVVDGGPGRRWFALQGELHAAATGTTAHSIESGLHWHALELPPAPADSAADERFSAPEDPHRGGAAWEGVVTVDVDPVGSAAATTERQVEARRFAAFEATSSDDDLDFTPTPTPRAGREGKFVHRDGLLAGPSPAASVRTAPEGGYTFVLDLGRLIYGTPNLRLREGHGGTVDIGLAAAWGRIDRRLRYVCGSGRQEWFALEPVRARYLVVRVSGFDEECLLERIALCERSVVTEAASELDLGDDVAPIWDLAPPSLATQRHDVYHVPPPPSPCDWLGVTTLLRNDAARCGHTDTARATLLGRAPTTSDAGAGFGLALETYHLWSGDDDTVAALLPAAIAACDVDGDNDEATAQLATRCLGTAATARLCRSLQCDADADRLGARTAEQQSALGARWKGPAVGYDGGAGEAERGQLTQALALLADTDAARRSEGSTLLRSAELTPVADLAQAWWLAEALWSLGADSRALEVVRNRWLRIAGREGPTWRDKHAAEAKRLAPGPEGLLTRWILGVQPVAGGLRHLRVRPALGALTQARGRLSTSAGHLGVAWQPDGEGAVRLTVETDWEGVTEIVVGRGGRRRPTLAVNGEVVWRNEKIYANPVVHEIDADDEAITLVVGRPGRWEVVVE
jgi:hypothetical protein